MIVEFLGLPGAGKSTIVRHVVATLNAQGVEVRESDDFVAWMHRQTRLGKLRMLIRYLPNALSQFIGALMLGLTLRSVRDFSIVRALRLPIINCCFDRYVELNRESLIIMDQANMQLVWSVGAFGSRYGTRQLNSLCRAARGNFERLFVFVAVSPEISAKRIRERATRSSRFDPLTGASLDSQLHAAASLMSDIHSHLATDNERLVVLDAEASPEANAANLVAEIGHFTRPPAKPADGAPEGSIHS